MNPESTPDPDERLGELADAFADASGSPRSADAERADEGDARLAAAVAAAFGSAIELTAGEVDAVLAEAGEDVAALPSPVLPDDYELGDEIGRGGMGVVYRAHQRSLERTVAVKVLRPGDLLFGNAIRRFMQEARLLAKLRHRHIVSVHEVGHVRGQVYYTMDLIEGRDLAQILRDGALVPAHAVRLMRQVASAIAYTHAHGLIHRDLKPANILVGGDGEACVTDFGLAMELGGGDQLTVTGQILGTPAYMSPEQARGDGAAVGEATDVWALGALLYECLTGAVPFERASPVEQIHAVIHDEPVRPRKVRPAVPEDLETICLKALEKRAEDRYPTARAFLEDLERWESGLPIRAAAASSGRRLARWVLRNRAPVVSAAAASLLAFLVFAFVVLPFVRQDDDTLRRTADEMLVAGRVEAAASLYTAVVEGRGDDHIDDALLARLVEARVEVARRLADDGRPEEAVEMLLATRQTGLVGRDPRTWVDGALLAFEAAVVSGGDAPKRYREFVDAYHKHTAESVARGETQYGGSVFVGAAALALSRLDGDDVRPGAPRRAFVRNMLDVVASAAMPWDVIHEWIVSDPARALDRLVVAGEAADSSMEWTGVRATASEVLDRAALDELDRQVRGASLDARGVRVAAHLLAWGGDLPVGTKFHPASRDDLMRDAFDAVAVADAWDAVRDLDPVAAWHARVELCLDETAHAARWPTELAGAERRVQAPRADLQDLCDWLSGHVGVPLRDTYSGFPQGAEEWRTRLAAADPRTLLAAAVGLAAPPSAEDVPRVVERMAKRPHQAVWMHHLLALVVPRDDVPVVFGGVGGSEIDRAWRRTMNGPPLRDLRVRWVRAEFSAGAWRLVGGTEETRSVRVGERVEIAWQASATDAASVSMGFHVPGTVQVGDGTATWTQTLTLVVDPENAELGLALPHVDGSPRRGLVVSPDHDLGRMSEPDRGRNTLVLAVVEEAASEAAPWTLDDWSAALAADVRRLADLNEATEPRYEFHNRQQRAVQETALVLAHLGVPSAADDLRRLHHGIQTGTERGRYPPTTETLLLARLMSGDAAALDDPELGAALAGGVGATTESVLGPGEKFWARLLLTASEPALRDFAATRLPGELTADVAGDLLEAADVTGVALPPHVAAVARQITPSLNPWSAGFAARPGPLVMAGMLALLAIAAVAGTALVRGPNRIIAASALVAVGLLMLSVHVRVGGTWLVPDALGAALVAGAIVVLVPHAPGYAARVALGAFAAATVLFALPFGMTPMLASVAVLVGISALVVTARDLTPVRPPVAERAPRRPARASRPNPFAGALISAFFAALLAAVVFRGPFLLGGALLLAFVALPFGVVFQGLRPTPPGRANMRAMPLPFVVCYIAPIALLHLAAVWQIARGGGGIEIRAEWAVAVLLLGLSVAVAWVAQRLFGAARVRAAALRDAQGHAAGSGPRA